MIIALSLSKASVENLHNLTQQINLNSLFKMLTFRKISRLFKNYFFVHVVQAGTLMSTGDLVAQVVVEKKTDTIDFERTIRFGFIGISVVGPAVSVWYRLLSKSKYSLLQRVAIDQLLFAPSLLPVMITSVNVLKGQNWFQIKDELKHKYFHILITNYKVWPLVQFINFKYIPLKYQVAFGQGVGIFWNTYLSLKIQ
ncbi:mpv17-like protein [Diabrotica virgifera virgifera]|uniref:Mitochondrial inner membrane protein Mpv17 n=1 Tax=Diabrotica virgifera virgifera TaxID=50390 RepID=A0A6P7FKF5_DIAVI|nr:mpv17-like protein [Diabrotica virgifera virgifera]